MKSRATRERERIARLKERISKTNDAPSPSSDRVVSVSDLDEETFRRLLPHGILDWNTSYRPPKFQIYVKYQDRHKVKSIPFASFHRGSKSWLLPGSFESVRKLRKLFPSLHLTKEAHEVAKVIWDDGRRQVELVKHLKALKAGEVDCSHIVGSKLNPYPYQAVGIAAIEKAWSLGYGFANLDEQGLGKTCTILLCLDRHFAENPDASAVVFAPKSLLHSVWVAEIVKFTEHLRPLVPVGSIKKRAKMVEERPYYEWTKQIPGPTGSPRTHFVKKSGNPNVILVNHEAMSKVYKTPSGLKFNELAVALMKMQPTFCVVDEMHKIANLSANRTKAILKVAKNSKHRHGMTGTPGLPEQLFGELKFIDRRIFPVNKGDFKRRYVNEMQTDMGFSRVLGYNHLEELERRTSHFSVRRTQADCPDIPEGMYQTIHCKMSDEQKKIYDRTADQILSFYQDHDITKVNLPAKLHGLRTTTGGHIKDSEGNVVRFKSNSKAKELIDFLTDEFQPDPMKPDEVKKTVVACVYREDVALLAEMIEAAGFPCVTITGDVVDTPGKKARTEAVRRFVEDPEIRVLVGVTSTFGVGLNLVPKLPMVADFMCFYSNSYDAKERDQAEKRILRGGQTRKVRFIDFVIPGTIDETILEIVRGKKAIQDVITGDNLRSTIKRDASRQKSLTG